MLSYLNQGVTLRWAVITMQITDVYSAHRAYDKVMGALRKIYDQVSYKSRRFSQL